MIIFPFQIGFQLLELILTPFRYMFSILLYIPTKVLDFFLKIVAVLLTPLTYLIDKIFGEK